MYAQDTSALSNGGVKYLSAPTLGGAWTIPNGNYNFYITGYSSAGMAGNYGCGLAANESLTGGSRVVSITTSAANCTGDAHFRVSTAAASTSVEACNSATDLTLLAPAYTSPTVSTCGSGTGGAVDPGVTSLYFAIISKDYFGTGMPMRGIGDFGGDKLLSHCVTQAGAVFNTNNPNLVEGGNTYPNGLSNIRPSYQVATFANSTCTGAPSHLYSFEFGLSTALGDSSSSGVTKDGVVASTSARWINYNGTAKLYLK